jgi:hypothetical protein
MSVLTEREVKAFQESIDSLRIITSVDRQFGYVTISFSDDMVSDPDSYGEWFLQGEDARQFIEELEYLIDLNPEVNYDVLEAYLAHLGHCL